jgi:hypothetical protein
MRFTVLALASFGALLSLSACQSEMMSNDRMTSSIAGVLGVSPSAVTLTDRRTDGPTNTFVRAHVTGGKTYACTVNGGGLLAMGMMNPPTCQPAQTSN